MVISYLDPLVNTGKKKGRIVRGVYDIETNNEKAKFIVGGLALNNGRESEDTSENYNITFHNKPFSILTEIYNHNKLIGGHNRYEIGVHNLMFDLQSLLYNILEHGKITYKEPEGYNRQAKDTYSLIMNNKKQVYSCTINYCGINILFWDTLKLYSAPLKDLCKVYQLQNYKKEAGAETYNSESFEAYVKDKVNVDYLINDLLSVAELIDRNYYKQKTASSNAFNSLKDELCCNLEIKKKTDNGIKTLIDFWGDNRFNDYYLPGYSGGFCYANPKYSSVELKNIVHLDINSSYPNAMNEIAFPMTHKLSKKIETEHYIIYVKGKFTLKDGSFPVIKHPMFMNQYLDLYKGELLVTEIEWERINKNYNVENLKIIEVLNFPKCERVLSSFVLKNYEIKQNATGFLREKAKLNLNSAYGKLAEHHNGQYYEAFITENDTINFRLTDSTINLIQTEKSRCVIWAMYITAFAREKLYKCIDVLGDDFIYTDTDSIFTTLDIKTLEEKLLSVGEIIDNKILGAWKVEGTSTRFKCIRAKCYLKTDDDPVKHPNVHKLNYVVAGYNGDDLIKGYHNTDISEIAPDVLDEIFDGFRLGAVFHDKYTSVTSEFGIKQIKVLTDYEIKDRVNNYEFINEMRGDVE